MSSGHHCLSPAHVLFLLCCFQTHLEIDGLSAAGEEGSCIQTQISAFNHKLVRMAPSSSNKVLVNKNHLLVSIFLPDSTYTHTHKGFFVTFLYSVTRPFTALSVVPLNYMQMQISLCSDKLILPLSSPPLSLLLNHSLGLKRSRT